MAYQLFSQVQLPRLFTINITYFDPKPTIELWFHQVLHVWL